MGQAAPIEFYFDFASPYGYLASTQIDVLAARHGRGVAWRPFVLGAAFKVTGQRALTEQPLRGPYAERDFARSARLLGVPFRKPAGFPFFARAASRGFYWLDLGGDARAAVLAKSVYHAAFGEGRDVAPAGAVAELARPLGIEGLEEGIELPRPRPGCARSPTRRSRAGYLVRLSSSSTVNPSGATTGSIMSSAGLRPVAGRVKSLLEEIVDARPEL
jgi:2-hydroxychromene-2-carboxylate isomerase